MKMTKQEWHLFGICLFPGLLWGFIGVAIVQILFGLNFQGMVYEWALVRVSMVIGMTFGVSSYAVNWLRRGCPKFTRFRDHLLESIKCVLYGIYCGCFGWMVVGAFGLLFGQPFAIFAALAAPLIGAIYAVFTVLPASILMRPLLNLLLEWWSQRHSEKKALEVTT